MTRRLAIALAMLATATCAPSWKRLPHDRPFQRAAPPLAHDMPQTATLSDWWDKVLHSTVVPLARLASPARLADGLWGGRKALDINAFGKVPDSAWFENRIGRRPMTPAEVATGNTGSGGPADGPLTVISGKLQGATPGVVVKDTADVVWFLKLDPPAFHELSTGAEVAASRILFAAGYHVPEMQVIDIPVRRFVRSPRAYRRDDYNRKVPMTDDDLDSLLSNLNPDASGNLRVLFSRAVPGRPIGPFSYRGIRDDDPNDRIPHERRRSLRGLWVISAWINNTDARRDNTIDTFVPEESSGGRLGHVQHYLIDFGDSFGASGDRVKYVGEGYEGQVHWREIGKRWAQFGLGYPYWLGVKRSPYRAVGVFEEQVFDPARWSPGFPNPAFDAATIHDTFWGASLIARFSRELVGAAVSAGRYSDSRSAERIIDILMTRRNKVLAYAFESMLPLDDPGVVDGYVVQMKDLEILAGLIDRSRYHWVVRWNRTRRRDRVLARGTGHRPSVDLRPIVRDLVLADHEEFARDPFLTISFRRSGHPARVELNVRVVADHVVPVSLSRQVARAGSRCAGTSVTRLLGCH